MRQAESMHRYPRLTALAIEGLSALLVVVTAWSLAAAVLRGLWDRLGRSEALFGQVPLLAEVTSLIDGASRDRADSLPELLGSLVLPLAWCAAALLAAMILRNALPAVRASAIGLLVEFSGSWLPISWEDIAAIKVTEDLAGERFVLLVEARRPRLTSWHRLYSLIYGRSARRAFYITSNISAFDQLVQTILTESERTARAVEGAQAVRLQEGVRSPLFRLLLSPGAFFSRSALSEAPAPGAPAVPSGGPVRAVYPGRITALLAGLAALLVLALVWNYLVSWSAFLALQLPNLRPLPLFSWTYGEPGYRVLYDAYRTRGVPLLGDPRAPGLPVPLWILLRAHIAVVLALPALIWLRNLLPSLESRGDGMAVRDMLSGRWRLIPWQRVSAFKVTELSEQSQILLLQSPAQPAGNRLTSLIYDGSSTPGLLITSAIGNYQPLLTHALGHLAPLEKEGQPPILRQEAASWTLWVAIQTRAALAALVGQARSDEATRQIETRRLLGAAAPMAGLALLPALLPLLGALWADSPPGLGLLGGVVALWLLGLLEWPLISLSSVLLDENTGGGEEGYRALYLYPLSQLPRLLPLVVAAVLQLVGLGALATVGWLAAAVWAYWLSRGLWEQLYGWRDSQAILGGLLPVFWQLLLLLGYLIASR